MIPETRQSERLQNHIIEQVMKSSPRKRNLEGTNLSNANSFAVLENHEIANLANNMGIVINENGFDKIDFMKDLEIARHNLDNKIKNAKGIEEPENAEDVNDDQTLFLEWTNADSDEEKFILVQSKRKKKE